VLRIEIQQTSMEITLNMRLDSGSKMGVRAGVKDKRIAKECGSKA
jgi:hypothetical protein